MQGEKGLFLQKVVFKLRFFDDYTGHLCLHEGKLYKRQKRKGGALFAKKSFSPCICPAGRDRIFEGVPIYGGGGRRYFFSDKYANLALLFFLTNLTLYDLTIILYDSTVINVTLYVYIIFFIKYVVPLPR